MTVTNRNASPWQVCATILVAGTLASTSSAQSPAGAASQTAADGWQASKTAVKQTTHLPLSSQQRRPLARLIRNPDTTGGLPPYALTDQSGAIQRYVEPVPGVDLEPYVGYAV